MHILFATLAMFLELFVCNIRSFQSLLYDEKDISMYPIRVDYADVLANGDIIVDDDVAYITAFVNGEKINNVHIDIEVVDPAYGNGNNYRYSDFIVNIQDELLYSGEINTRVAAQRKVLHDLPSSQYVFFESFGKTQTLILEIRPQDSGLIRIHDITFNARRPVMLSFPRLFVLFMFFELIFLFRPSSWIWKRKALEPGKRGYIILAAAYIAILVGFCGVLIRNPSVWNNKVSPYANLAKAFASGEVSVGTATEEISALEDKIVSWGSDDDRIMFDYAIYKGKYYVYFGVLPCILFYLPYHLITGFDLPDAVSMIIMFALLIPGVYLLYREIIKKFFNNTDFAMHLLLTIATVFGSNTIAVMAEPSVYQVAVVAGVLLSVWGLFGIISALPFAEHVRKLLPAAGCLALVAACRPTMLIYSAVLIPLFIYSFCQWKESGEKPIKLIRMVIALAVPYIIVAGALMFYNVIRFDSPFQFGMIYNMTAVPSKKTAVSVLEMVPLLIYEYFLRLPLFDYLFPFLHEHVEDCVIMMSGTIYYFQYVGYGLFAVNPVLWILFSIPFISHKIQKHSYTWAAGIGVACSIFLMFFGFYMTQLVASRYTMEFSYALFVVAVILWLRAWPGISELYPGKFIRGIFAISVMLPMIIQSMQIFISYSYPLDIGNPEFYYRMFYNWCFL